MEMLEGIGLGFNHQQLTTDHGQLTKTKHNFKDLAPSYHNPPVNFVTYDRIDIILFKPVFPPLHHVFIP